MRKQCFALKILGQQDEKYKKDLLMVQKLDFFKTKFLGIKQVFLEVYLGSFRICVLPKEHFSFRQVS